MDDLEVFRLSAEACGYEALTTFDWATKKPLEVHVITDHTKGPDWAQLPNAAPGKTAEVWNPFTNDSQRWLCVRKLLEMGEVLEFRPDNFHVMSGEEKFERAYVSCPAEEFPARALAELWRRKNG